MGNTQTGGLESLSQEIKKIDPYEWMIEHVWGNKGRKKPIVK